MAQWKSTREPPKTKAELREMLAEAAGNTARADVALGAARASFGKK
jgi:hypothetical protein